MINQPTNTIEIILEKHDGILWGRVEGKGNYMPTPYGKDKAAVIANLKDLITDYVRHEGKKDPFWSKINLRNAPITFSFDLEAYFKEHDYLKISSVAKEAGLNAGLVRQYASGVKFPSVEQVKKIYEAIQKIALELQADLIYAG